VPMRTSSLTVSKGTVTFTRGSGWGVSSGQEAERAGSRSDCRAYVAWINADKTKKKKKNQKKKTVRCRGVHCVPPPGNSTQQKTKPLSRSPTPETDAQLITIDVDGFSKVTLPGAQCDRGWKAGRPERIACCVAPGVNLSPPTKPHPDRILNLHLVDHRCPASVPPPNTLTPGSTTPSPFAPEYPLTVGLAAQLAGTACPS